MSIRPSVVPLHPKIRNQAKKSGGTSCNKLTASFAPLRLCARPSFSSLPMPVHPCSSAPSDPSDPSDSSLQPNTLFLRAPRSLGLPIKNQKSSIINHQSLPLSPITLRVSAPPRFNPSSLQPKTLFLIVLSNSVPFASVSELKCSAICLVIWIKVLGYLRCAPVPLRSGSLRSVVVNSSTQKKLFLSALCVTFAHFA